MLTGGSGPPAPSVLVAGLSPQPVKANPATTTAEKTKDRFMSFSLFVHTPELGALIRGGRQRRSRLQDPGYAAGGYGVSRIGVTFGVTHNECLPWRQNIAPISCVGQAPSGGLSGRVFHGEECLGCGEEGVRLLDHFRYTFAAHQSFRFVVVLDTSIEGVD